MAIGLLLCGKNYSFISLTVLLKQVYQKVLSRSVDIL